VLAGLAMVDTMRFVKPPVHTTCCGIAMSISAVILAAGEPGQRSTLPNGRMLIHQPSGGFQGQSSDIAIHARETLAIREQVDALLAGFTGQTVERIREDSDRDRFFTPTEALAYGLVDRVVDVRP
jgi:ATP-dependent Clp protease protease subunit